MLMTGVVFNIQKFSIHDGPGVRTTVFLKGCPLRCAWCSNPESQLLKVQVSYDARSCAHCGHCAEICPREAICIWKDGRVHVDFARCAGCMLCVQECPTRSLSREGEIRTVEDCVDVCMQDFDFYEESGGGVTISGGEGMGQPDFTEALVQALKQKGIHTAIETTGCVSEATFRRLAPQFDLLLFDVKHFDSDKHHAGTAVGNELILRNLRWAHEQGVEILPRIPVIPGFNDSLTDAAGIAALLNDIGLKRVQLLPFHQMGENKYTFLNRTYTLAGLKALHPEDLQEYQKVFLDAGLDCFF